MKYFYLAITIEENGKLYAYVRKVSELDDITEILHGVKHAMICPTKKAACKIVTWHNDLYKALNKLLFDSPNF